MVWPYLTSSIIFGSLFGLMATGLTLTYITTKVPNFAYGSFVTIGLYTSYSMNRFSDFSPYMTTPIAFGIGGVSSVLIDLGILRPLARSGSSVGSLMITTLAIDIGFIRIFGIYADYLLYGFDFTHSCSLFPV